MTFPTSSLDWTRTIECAQRCLSATTVLVDFACASHVVNLCCLSLLVVLHVIAYNFHSLDQKRTAHTVTSTTATPTNTASTLTFMS